MERLADLDELILRCRTVEAREHVSEAVASYRGGAFRAAIVMSWIAVVFDLIDKVRELGIAGEPAAAALMVTFENYQEQIHAGAAAATKQALEFERNLLTRVSTDLSLLDALQLSDLERLREDRHRSAHPSFNRTGEAFKPTAELARLHLRNAITHVLSQPPVQGKAVLATLRALVVSDYFPTDVARARIQLAGAGLTHATEALVKGFVDLLVFGYVTIDGDLHQLPQVLTALTATLDLHRGVAEPRSAVQARKVVRTANDEQLPTAVGFVAAWPAAWAHLEAVERDKIIAFIAATDYEDLEDCIPGLAGIADLHAPLQERLRQLDTTQLETLIQTDGLPGFVADAAIARYLASTSYNAARVRRRRLIMPLLDHLNADHVIAVVAGAGANPQVNEENYFPTLLRRLRDLEIIPLAAFIAAAEEAGLAEMIIEDDDL